MLRKLRPRITYANVVSTIALGLAIGGGTAYAATKIGTSNIRYHAVTGSKIASNAVTASKVRNGALSGSDILDNSLTSADVRNGTLQASDFAANQLPKGEKGDPATSIFGVVSAAGVLASAKNVTNLSSTDAGVYTVTMSQDVSKCAAIATLSGGDAGTVSAEPTTGNAQQITFQTRDAATPPAGARRAFQFAVYC